MTSNEGEPPEVSIRRRQKVWQKSFDLYHYNRILTPTEDILPPLIKDKNVPWWTSKRFCLSVIGFLGFTFMQALRVNLSLAIVCMVDHGIANNTNSLSLKYNSGPNYTYMNHSTIGTDITNTTPVDSQCNLGASLADTELEPEFQWSKRLQGLLLGAFFWGYLAIQIPSGWLSERFGPKLVIAAGMFPCAILNILTPVSARQSPYLLLVVRAVSGMGQAVMYPASQTLWARWAPPHERSRLFGFVVAGSSFGNVLAYPVGGVLCKYGFDGGWPSVFYVLGLCSFVWCIVWVIFVHDTPEETPSISDAERQYIEASFRGRVKYGKITSTPWRAILTSTSVWAIIIAHVCSNYTIFLLLTHLPTYIKEVLMLDIQENGLYSMLAYVCFWLCIILAGVLADLFIGRDIMSIAKTRKLFTVIGLVGGSLFLVATGYMDCADRTAAVVLLCSAVGLFGFIFSGFFVNPCDIAPQYAGTLFGISNTAAAMPGIVVPYIVASLTIDKTREQWQTAFYIAAAVNVFGALVFVIFASGKVQPWACNAVESGVLNGQEDHRPNSSLLSGSSKDRRSNDMRFSVISADNETSHVTIEANPSDSFMENAYV